MNPQDNVKTAKQAYENYRAGNIPSLLKLVSDNVEWVLPEVPGVAVSGTRQGRDGVTDFFARWRRVRKSSPLSRSSSSPKAIKLWFWAATHSG